VFEPIKRRVYPLWTKLSPLLRRRTQYDNIISIIARSFSFNSFKRERSLQPCSSFVVSYRDVIIDRSKRHVNHCSAYSLTPNVRENCPQCVTRCGKMKVCFDLCLGGEYIVSPRACLFTIKLFFRCRDHGKAFWPSRGVYSPRGLGHSRTGWLEPMLELEFVRRAIPMHQGPIYKVSVCEFESVVRLLSEVVADLEIYNIT